MSYTILISRGQWELSAAKPLRVNIIDSNMNCLSWFVSKNAKTIILYVDLKNYIHISKL
jgi:hypothetical protein